MLLKIDETRARKRRINKGIRKAVMMVIYDNDDSNSRDDGDIR